MVKNYGVTKQKLTQKQMRVRLIFFAVLIAAGCVIFGLMMAAVINPFGEGAMFGILAAGLFAAGVGNYFAGYRKKIKLDGAPKAGRLCSFIALAIVVSGLITAIALPVVPAMMRAARNGELNNALKKYIRDEWSSTNANVPENPKFVLYDMEKKQFSYPVDGGIGKEKHLCDHKYAAKTPDEANIAIGYANGGTGTYGYWYDTKTGKKTEDAITQKASFYAIKIDDWSLIDAVNVSEQLQRGQGGANPRGMINAYDITYVIENGRFPKKK